MSGSVALLVEAARASLPEVPLDKGVVQANTGWFLLDSVPLLTMAPAAQMLQIYWQRRRYTDFSLFLIGFILALIYHVLHMHPEGIANAEFLGMSGPNWRALDILMAQALMGRTFAHALGATSRITLSLPSIVYPASLLIYAHGLADGVLTLGIASKTLGLVLLATLASKLLLEGVGSLPQYNARRGKRTLACFVLAFIAFPMPELFPRQYWLFHSIWHCLMAEGYVQLYTQLEELRPHTRPSHKHTHKAEAVLPSDEESETLCCDPVIGSTEWAAIEQPSSLSGDTPSASDALDASEDALSDVSEASECERLTALLDGSESGGEGEVGGTVAAAARSASAGLVEELLLPAARLVSYQRQQQRLERRRVAAAGHCDTL